MKEEIISNIIKIVKEKRELRGLNNSLIREAIEEYVKNHNLSLSSLNKKDIKIIVKEARSELRKYSGMFSMSSKEKTDFSISKNFSKILKSHSSTNERIESYKKIKRILNKLKAKSILDLGCGVNPIALANKKFDYYACDINEEDIRIIDLFFKAKKIRGKTFICDLRKENSFPKVDLALILKVLDIIDKKGHKIAEKIIRSVDAKYLLISFSSKTLSGRPMNHPQRGWIERLLTRIGHNFTTFSTKNEIFYLVLTKKQP